MTTKQASCGCALKFHAWAIAVFFVAVGLNFAGCGCARYDIFYEYGAVSFINTGGGRLNQMSFDPEKSADTIYLRYFSSDVIDVRTMTADTARKHPVLGQYVSSDNSLLIGMFYFSKTGELEYLHIDGGDPGEVQVSLSPDGPFVDLPMTVQTMRATFGPPKKVSYAKVNR